MKLARVLIGLFAFLPVSGKASQNQVYRNEENGVILPVPAGGLLCKPPAYEGTGADHGAQMLLGTVDAALCSKWSGKRYMEVFASYRTGRTLHGGLESQCNFEVKRACSPSPANLQIKGMKSESGQLVRSDGSIEILLVTEAGKPDPNFDVTVPSMIYTLGLVTRVLRNSLETRWRAVSFFVSFVRNADYFTMDISGNSTPG